MNQCNVFLYATCQHAYAYAYVHIKMSFLFFLRRQNALKLSEEMGVKQVVS